MNPSDPKNSPADRIRLETGLKRDISKLRTRGIDEPRVADLMDLTRVAEAFAPKSPSAYERVEALIEAAIREHWGTSNFATVIQRAFGLDHNTRGLGPTERYKAAYKAYGTNSESNFTTHVLPKVVDKDLAAQCAEFYVSDVVANEPPAPSSPSDLGDARHKAPDHPKPSGPDDSAAGRAPHTDTDPRTHLALIGGKIPPPYVLALSVAIAMALAWLISSGTFNAGNPTSTDESFPRTSAVVNARTGAVVTNPIVEPASKADSPQLGELMLCFPGECAGKDGPEFRFTAMKPANLEIGEPVEAKFLMFNEGSASLPFFHLQVSVLRRLEADHNMVRLKVTINWPTSNGLESYSLPPAHFMVRTEPPGRYLLGASYMAGSTRLESAHGKQIGRLPDGIMGERGISLTDLGAPETCLCREYAYRRYVSFQFRLIDEFE